MTADRASFPLRLIDAVLRVALRPRLRRVLRWSFVVTLPLAALFLRARGVEAGLALAAAEFVAFMLVLATALRVGGERGELILDLIMHPAVRRLVRSEVAILLTLPDALTRPVRRRRPRQPRFAYARGNVELPIALALTPAVLAETAAVHLLLPGAWLVVKIVAAAISGYGLLWLLGWAAGLRLYPHEVRDGVLYARLGQLYRARVPLAAVRGIAIRRAKPGQRTQLVLDDHGAALAVDGRTDVELDLSHPVVVERPVGDPVSVTRLALACDDPRGLVAALTPTNPNVGLGAGTLDQEIVSCPPVTS